jgi:hypothetical protein
VTALSSAGSKIFALTLDGRLMLNDLDVVSLRDTPTITTVSDVIITPNPVLDLITVSHSGPRGSPLSFAIYNAAGIRVLSQEDVAMQPWEERRSISVASLRPGVYFVVTRGERPTIRGFSVLR